MVSAAFSVTCARTHTHTIEAHTADNRRTLGSKLIITPWRSQRSLSIRREGTSLSNREITLSLSITKDLTEYRIFGITKHHNDEKKKKSGVGVGEAEFLAAREGCKTMLVPTKRTSSSSSSSIP